MKKSSIIVSLLAAMILLTACGQAGTGPEAAAETAQTASESTAEPVKEAAPAENEEPAEEETSAELSMKEIAVSLIGHPVEELYEAIGKPTDCEYGPSCQGSGKGEDGVLFYDGFTVYTYRENGEETVNDAE